MKAVILARVSTKEQEEQGHSLPAQLASLRKYADKKGFEVAKEFSFSESAGPKIRNKFEEVLNYLRQNKDVTVLLCENVDRATRNFRDAVDLDDMRINEGLEIHFVKDGFFINAQATGNQMFMWEAKVFIAKQYLNRLSDDVKRSVKQMLENGEWPGPAPIGYIRIKNDDGTSPIVPDAQKAHLIRELFMLYGKGTYSIKTLKKAADELGLVGTRGGKPLSPSLIHHILKNPFYYGTMRSKHGDYPHHYEPLISKNLFLRCKEVTDSYHKKPHKTDALPFMFRGMIRCEKCGCMVTPEIHKGKYVYYSCTNFKGLCAPRKYIAEKKLLEPVYEALKGIQMPPERIDELTQGLKKLGQSENDFFTTSIQGLRVAFDSYEERISKMYDDKLDGRITEEMYDKKLKEYKEKQNDLTEKMKDHSEADHEFYVTANIVFNLGKRALEIFESSEVPEKRQFLNFLLQNCTLSGQNLRFNLKEPFNKVIETKDQPIGLPG